MTSALAKLVDPSSNDTTKIILATYFMAPSSRKKLTVNKKSTRKLPNFWLLDDLIRPLQHAAWNCQSDLFCRLEVNDEFKLRRLLHRQISRFGTLEDLVYVHSRAPIEVIEVRPIGHET